MSLMNEIAWSVIDVASLLICRVHNTPVFDARVKQEIARQGRFSQFIFALNLTPEEWQRINSQWLAPAPSPRLPSRSRKSSSRRGSGRRPLQGLNPSPALQLAPAPQPLDERIKGCIVELHEKQFSYKAATEYVRKIARPIYFPPKEEKPRRVGAPRKFNFDSGKVECVRLRWLATLARRAGLSAVPSNPQELFREQIACRAGLVEKRNIKRISERGRGVHQKLQKDRLSVK